jgi:hypothetical protein
MSWFLERGYDGMEALRMQGQSFTRCEAKVVPSAARRKQMPMFLGKLGEEPSDDDVVVVALLAG